MYITKDIHLYILTLMIYHINMTLEFSACHTPPESVLSKYGVSLRILTVEDTAPRRMRTVPFV